MDTQNIITALIVSVPVLFLTVIFLAYRQQKMHKRVGEIFDTSKKGDIYSILEQYLKNTREVEEYAKKLEKEMAKISKKMQKSIQKVGFVRYNPFGKNDTGGNQSFSVALLDNEDNGFVLTSMHSREGTRVYAKKIEEGKSVNTLTDEETEVIKKTI